MNDKIDNSSLYQDVSRTMGPQPNEVLIVIDSTEQWAPYYTSESVVTVDTYLQDERLGNASHLVINLCSDLSYLSAGYYCSLLAQARKQRVIPSIETLNKFDCNVTPKIDLTLLDRCTCKCGELEVDDSSESYSLDLYFGKPEDKDFTKIGRALFEQYPAPLLRVTISRRTPHHILRIRNLTLEELTDRQEDFFANSLDTFNKKVWRNPKGKKPPRYDLAIFYDPAEKMPPSNKKALKLFLSEAKKMDINAELLTEEESGRLLEFDALFIRQTTSVDNVTYRMALAAEQADMVVIDDPSSIIRCTNKVYLKEHLDGKSVPTPRSKLLFSENPPSFKELTETLASSMVLKIPDGSFSVGMYKVSSESEYKVAVEELGGRSSVLLAQEFVPTPFDWRIGVLNGEAIFACKYFMAKGHWQIYNHTRSGSNSSGTFETLPVHLVPRKITRLAEKASNSIGKGLYGVDMKETDRGLMVIEVNDNPSIDSGVEDLILGTELYRIILREFVARLDGKRSK